MIIWKFIFYTLALLAWLWLDGKIKRKEESKEIKEWRLKEGAANKKRLIIIVIIYTFYTLLEIILLD